MLHDEPQAETDYYIYMLYIPDEIDRDRIRFLHECRNSIAHISICEPEQVRKLLDKCDLVTTGKGDVYEPNLMP